MNPLFGNIAGIGDVLRIYKQARQNPSMVGDLLYQNGRISQEQMEAMKWMNPQQMGNYLASNGIMPQNFLQKGTQFANPIRGSLNGNN